METRKQFLLSKIKPFSDESGRTNILQTYIDYTSADLISRYLSSKRPFSLSFDGYLKQVSFLLLFGHLDNGHILLFSKEHLIAQKIYIFLGINIYKVYKVYI